MIWQLEHLTSEFLSPETVDDTISVCSQQLNHIVVFRLFLGILQQFAKSALCFFSVVKPPQFAQVYILKYCPLDFLLAIQDFLK